MKSGNIVEKSFFYYFQIISLIFFAIITVGFFVLGVVENTLIVTCIGIFFVAIFLYSFLGFYYYSLKYVIDNTGVKLMTRNKIVRFISWNEALFIKKYTIGIYSSGRGSKPLSGGSIQDEFFVLSKSEIDIENEDYFLCNIIRKNRSIVCVPAIAAVEKVINTYRQVSLIKS